ncbi:MAG TPA: hypothetical protein VFY29_05245 [Terriglobia bacterium]|nr:hypothetical protein [Terriglobia bacterium]
MNWITTVLMVAALTAQADTLIERAGLAAESFWSRFSEVQARERVTQARLQADGKVVSTRTADFDYLAILKARSNGVAIEEWREPRTNPSPGKAEPALVTSGFPALLLMFHPDLRGKFDFQDSPAQSVPPGIVRIAFRSRPGQHSMSALKFNGRLYPIQWRGFAWIESATGNVTHIEASLDAPMDDLGLSALTAEVDYGPATLGDTGTTYWLPSRATVTARTPKQQWRDIHEFSAYRLFAVTTTTNDLTEQKEQ